MSKKLSPEEAIVIITAFKDRLVNNLCPFCNQKLKFYDGALGYEAFRCYRCHFEIDHYGMRFMEEL